MKSKVYLLTLLFLFGSRFSAQSFIHFGQIGSFTSAISFSVNPQGFIFVSDNSTNELIKLDTLGNVLKTIGGYGWDRSSFDNPVDIFATTLNVYVSDKNNHRIQIFDKDLNFLSQFSNYQSGKIFSFSYPTCAAVSDQGDLFILDSDNKRILKFNLRGEFQLTIGGYEAGTFALSNPMKFAITGNANIYVLDSSTLFLFDQFGNGRKKIKLSFEPANVNATFEAITLNDQSNVAVIFSPYIEEDFLTPKIFSPSLDEEIIDSFLFNSKLFVLTKSCINIYNIVRQK